MADGVYLYKAEDNSLVQIMSEDIRGITSAFEYVKTAPLNLVYIADNSKLKNASESDEEKLIYNSADAGFIIQNVYLYCASQGFSSVVYGGVNRKALTEKLNLRSDQKIILAQSVGFPKD
jgi:nitroreductase